MTILAWIVFVVSDFYIIWNIVDGWRKKEALITVGFSVVTLVFAGGYLFGWIK